MKKQTKTLIHDDGSRIRVCDLSDSLIVAKAIELRREALELSEIAQTVLATTRHWHEFLPPVFDALIRDIQRRLMIRAGFMKRCIGLQTWILG